MVTGCRAVQSPQSFVSPVQAALAPLLSKTVMYIYIQFLVAQKLYISILFFWFLRVQSKLTKTKLTELNLSKTN